MSRIPLLTATVLGVLALAAFGAASAEAAEFGIESFDATTLEADGSAATEAGAHPYSATTTFSLDSTAMETPEGPIGVFPNQDMRNVAVELPPGVTINPTVVPTCNESEIEFVGIESLARPTCPITTQVGTATLHFAAGFDIVRLPVYNMVPPPGYPAALAFNALGQIVVHILPTVRTGTDSGITAKITDVAQTNPISYSELTLWGVPADESHNPQRGQNCIRSLFGGELNCILGNASANIPPRAFLSNPTRCAGPLTTHLAIETWAQPGRLFTTESVSHDSSVPPSPVGISGCDRVPFKPEMSAQPTERAAASPSGFAVDLHLPQEGLENPTGRASGAMKEAVVRLPGGLAVNPSSANGLSACSPEQIGLLGTEFAQPNPIHFTESPAACPESSKLGTVELKTPLLDDPLEGSIYLAQQGSNPFHSLLALYLVAEGHGIVLKLPGRIETSNDGQITTTFDNSPQLPFEDLHVEFAGGSQASLVTPSQCGEYSTTGEFTPWSGGPAVVSTSKFQITTGPNGGPCPNGGFEPRLAAGTTNPVGGAYSPFELEVSRADGTAGLSSITAKLPKGLLGKLAGIPYCSDQALAGIPTGEGTGAAEVAGPSCPAASRVGSVSVDTGAGSTPFHVGTGSAYLAGPYKGAPLSMAFVTPAVAGPFDLGNVVVRTALELNPETAQITAVSDPLPTVLDGIPLNLRNVRVRLDRDKFTLNPTSCNPMQIDSALFGVGGGQASPSSHFQVAGCERLRFKPKLALSVKGATHRAAHPAFKAVLTAPPGQANIGRAAVSLPPTEFLENAHIRTVCTRVQFKAGAGGGAECPKGSIYGRARAWTPLLDKPLEGPVFLRSSDHTLPDLVASLDGQIHIDLDGRIDSPHKRIRNTFAMVPDAPVSKFVLKMQGGKKGLLVNNTQLCRTTPKGTAVFTGQNAKQITLHPVMKAECGRKKPKKKK